MFILTSSTLLNSGALRTRMVPKTLLRSGSLVLPRRLFLSSTFWRLLFESSIVRHLLVIAPIPLAVLYYPEHLGKVLAVPPVLLLLMLFFEGNVIPVRARHGDDTHADRGLDLLAQRGKALLTRIAAERSMVHGRLVLVVEQSDMARLPPLTFVSVQTSGGTAMLDLTAAEREVLRNGLFDERFDESDLLRINLVQKKPLRLVALDAATISAHARLAAMARGRLNAPD